MLTSHRRLKLGEVPLVTPSFPASPSHWSWSPFSPARPLGGAGLRRRNQQLRGEALRVAAIFSGSTTDADYNATGLLTCYPGGPDEARL